LNDRIIHGRQAIRIACLCRGQEKEAACDIGTTRFYD
jgi:hypothetical protein